MTNLIAITIGDINGIGINILINTWKKNKINKFVLFTDIKVFKKYLNKNKTKLDINIINNNKNKIGYIKNKFNIYDFRSNSEEDNSFKSLKFAYKLCVEKIFIGIVTLPLRKDLIKQKISKNFIGHTEFFQKIDKKQNVNMILFHKKIIISTMTTHIKIKNISKIISKNNFLFNKIINLNNTLRVDFNLKKPKIIISGLNPHAGENGEIGDEEIKIIVPTIKKLRNKGVNIIGPVSADSILINKNMNKYDCYVFIFHDQALIPFKYISQFTGVNYTGSLSVIRTSPDHGTAYDMIGSKEISSQSFMNCIKLIKKIYRNKKLNDKS